MKLLHILLSNSGEGVAVGLMNGAIIAIVLGVIYYLKDKREKKKKKKETESLKIQ